MIGELAYLRRFVCELTTLVNREASEAEILDKGGAALAELVSADNWLPPEFAEPDPAQYRQYLLHCDPLERFSIVSFVWGPGQSTPVHDHTVWGLIGMLRGAEISRNYRADSSGALVVDTVHHLEPGVVSAVSPRIGDIHQVANALADRASISIHAYGAISAPLAATFSPPKRAKRAPLSRVTLTGCCPICGIARPRRGAALALAEPAQDEAPSTATCEQL
jgi:predicted metal-dependent enzyme (double-stranded beta helix superfamily)